MSDNLEGRDDSFSDLRFTLIHGYSRYTFKELSNVTKKKVIGRLKLLCKEFDDRSEEEVFSPEFLNYTANLKGLINTVLSVNQEALRRIVIILFEKVRETKENEDIEEFATDIEFVTYFVNLLQRIGFEGDDFSDINDTNLYKNLLDLKEKLGKEVINSETLNWEYTCLRAEYKYGINLDENFQAHRVLGDLNYIISYISSDEDNRVEGQIKKELKELIDKLKELEELREARNNLKTNKNISKEGLSLLAEVGEATVENSSIRDGILVQVDKPFVLSNSSKDNIKTSVKKNRLFTAKSSEVWLKSKKNYFNSLFDKRFPHKYVKEERLLSFGITSKEELDKFIKDNEESKKRITEYHEDTVFAINPNKSLDNFKGLQKERLEWLGLDGKSLRTIVKTENPYHKHQRIRSPYTHIGYDLNQERVVIKEEES
jgi:hypothetical protein